MSQTYIPVALSSRQVFAAMRACEALASSTKETIGEDDYLKLCEESLEELQKAVTKATENDPSATYIPLALKIDQAAAIRYSCETMAKAIRLLDDPENTSEEAASVFDSTIADIDEAVREVDAAVKAARLTRDLWESAIVYGISKSKR